MIGVIAVGALFLVGAYFLVRAPPPPPRGALPDADALLLRDAVLHKLRERLVGWSFETTAEEPLQIVALESGSERRLTLDLKQLAQGWHPLHQRGAREEAETLVEAYVQGATGETSGSDEALDTAWVEGALAVQLVAPGQAPAGALTRPAGALQAVLVLRNPEGPAPVTSEDLASWNLDPDRAFDTALENLAGDVAEGLHLEPLEGTDALDVAAGDPLAASYALVPQLGELLSRRFGKPAELHLVGPGRLVATPGGGGLPDPLKESPTLLEGAISTDILRLGR